ncbi:MAG: triose-phosphate isomerase [Acidobacteriota bacterium]
MRRPLIAGNWKMHKTIPEASALAAELASSCGEFGDIDIAVAPPFPALTVVRSALQGSTIGLGAQNMHWEDKGAFTGEVSPPQLRDAGCRYVILGHSERRQYFAETDENVNRKVRAAFSHGLVPIVCVGESEEERDRGVTFVVVDRQVNGALKNVAASQLPGLVIAYEPIWAIGTGRTATPAQAQEVHRAIRSRLGALFGAQADAVRILYGGSVKADNIDELMGEADIDGALAGGASLEAASFTRICGFERSL